MQGIERIKLAVREAERLAREEGGTFEGWLWYLLQPPGFVENENEIIIEYYIGGIWSCEAIRKYIIDKKTHEVREEEEECPSDLEDIEP